MEKRESRRDKPHGTGSVSRRNSIALSMARCVECRNTTATERRAGDRQAPQQRKTSC